MEYCPRVALAVALLVIPDHLSVEPFTTVRPVQYVCTIFMSQICDWGVGSDTC